MPLHEFVDARLWPAVHQAGQQVGEVGLRLDAVQFAGLDHGFVCQKPGTTAPARMAAPGTGRLR